MNPLPETRSYILPEVVRKTTTFLFTHVIPLSLLVLLNGTFFWILSSELDTTMRWKWSALLFLSVCLLGVTLLFLREDRKTTNTVHLIHSFVLLACLCGYLTLTTFWHSDLVPEAESLWILDPLRFLGLQFTLLMSAVFHNALQLACVPLKLKEKSDLLITILGSIFLPFSIYLVVVLLGEWSFFGGVFFILIAGCTLITMMLILRAISLLYLKVSGSQTGETLLILFFGLGLPMGGLLLNRRMPFPADYQQSIVYILTLLNSLILLVSLKNRFLRSPLLIWFFQWALLPFSLYFFLVFLPWLPLSLLAMIAFGAGFLILAPTGLLLVHSLRIAKTRRELSDQRSRGILIGIATAGFLLLPGTFVLRSLNDRATLNAAIVHVFEPRFEAETDFTGNPKVLRRSLDHLVKHYEGRYVPYLSDLYDALVFQGLVLPQSKMDTLYKTFFGEDAPEVDGGEWDFMSTSSRRNSRNPRGRPPPKNGVLKDVEWNLTHKEGITEITATLTLHNPSSRQSEFVQQIALPPGVWVSGYWLDVEGVRKPGRITERKTATWVYKTIRDATRRDPGLLVYDGPNALELRVFPLEPDQTRITGITFSAISRSHLALTIGKNSLPSQNNSENPTALKGSNSVSIPLKALADSKPIERKPYLYLVVDRSVKGPENSDEAMEKALAPHLERWGDQIAGCRVVLVNHNLTFSESEIDWPQEVESIIPETEREGGLLLEHAVVQIVRDHQRLMNEDEMWATTFPLPVWALGDGKTGRTDLPLEKWVHEIPEWDMAEKEHRIPMTIKSKSTPVWIFKTGKKIHAKEAQLTHMDLWMDNTDDPVELYDPASKTFVPAFTDIPSSERYDGFSRSWQAYRSRLENRELTLRDVVSISRETGVLLPVTAYIVLENEAQEKMMKLKEQQKLLGLDSLEFMDTPEPDLMLLLGMALLLALAHKGLKK